MDSNLCEKEIEGPWAGAHSSVTPGPVLHEFRRLSARRRETLEFHMPYREETRMLLAVKNGDPEGFRQVFTGFPSGNSASAGMMSEDALLQIRYSFVVGITLYTRFAVEGGLDQEEAYNLSDAYIRVMSAMGDPGRILELSALSGADFATRVREARRAVAPAVKACRAYISDHLHYKITVAELARSCGLTPNYLSALFHRQMGVSLQAYLLGEKLEAARRMLVSTNCSVADAASQFAFTSHSGFAAHFKRKYGLTPTRCRSESRSAAWAAL